MPSFRLALSPRDCSSISLSLPPSLSGTRSGPGCEPFVPVSRHRSWSSQTPCARHFPIFSWLPQKPILSRNSSPIGRTRKICGFSAWLRDQKNGLLREIVSDRAVLILCQDFDRAFFEVDTQQMWQEKITAEQPDVVRPRADEVIE